MEIDLHSKLLVFGYTKKIKLASVIPLAIIKLILNYYYYSFICQDYWNDIDNSRQDVIFEKKLMIAHKHQEKMCDDLNDYSFVSGIMQTNIDLLKKQPTLYKYIQFIWELTILNSDLCHEMSFGICNNNTQKENTSWMNENKTVYFLWYPIDNRFSYCDCEIGWIYNNYPSKDIFTTNCLKSNDKISIIVEMYHDKAKLLYKFNGINLGIAHDDIDVLNNKWSLVIGMFRIHDKVELMKFSIKYYS